MNKKSTILKIILGLIFAISFEMISFQLIIVYNTIINWITGGVSFFCALYFWKITVDDTYDKIKKNKAFSVICAFLTSIVIYKLYLVKGMQFKDGFNNWIINPFRLRSFIISGISAIYIGIFLGNKLKECILYFYSLFDSWDKKAYIILSGIWLIAIIVTYSFNSNWYQQYDKVYSLDSGWYLKNAFPNPTYYDIRHPILSIFTFPMYAIVDTLVKIIFNGSLSEIVITMILQFINVQMIISTGFLIKFLTKNKAIFILYMISFPTIIFSLFFEKYSLCVFLLVLYVFFMCNGKNKKSIFSFVSAIGCMPTSVFIGILELLTSNKFKEKVIKILKIVIATILIFICLGRASTLLYGFSDTLRMKNQFSSKTLDITERIVSTLKMIQGSIIALSSIISDKLIYTWDDSLTTEISAISLIVLAIMAIGSIKNWKSLFVKGCTIWIGFSFILFVILKWSTKSSPLFSLYFSWAVIPLFVMGLDYIIDKLKINKKIVYGIIFPFIIIVNFATIFDITKFLTIL